jgi:hypothetical protein
MVAIGALVVLALWLAFVWIVDPDEFRKPRLSKVHRKRLKHER